MNSALPPGTQDTRRRALPASTAAFRPWTDAEIELLKARTKAGRSARDISAELKDRSRCAVIGMWKRLGMSTPFTAKPKDIAKLKPPGRLQNPTRILAKAKANGHDPGLAEEQPSDAAGITLDELTNTTCRWPSGTPGEDDFRYCGRPGADMTAKYPLPYCGAHSRMAYEPAKPRRARQ